MRLSPFETSATILHIEPAPAADDDDNDECGAVGH
jgi:hypothetical protein